ncbi:MAG: MOSC domain-containing protein [Planctomycetaceae bacterium]
MATTHAVHRGSVVALWRYPVKSMIGEELNASDVTERGLLGDRAYALVDAETGMVVSAKNPRKWGNMFDFRAAFVAPPRDPGSLPPARITFPDGAQVTTDQADVDRRLSASMGRPVRLAASVPDAPILEGYWPEHEWLPNPDQVFEVAMPSGTFFDLAVVHLITTATLDRLRDLAPKSRFEVRRFRPNLVIKVSDGAEGFVEDEWIGRTLSLGGEVQLRITQPCPRSVMTPLSQGDLPKDPAILRAAVQHNQGYVGVYASVLRGGRVLRGDEVVCS